MTTSLPADKAEALPEYAAVEAAINEARRLNHAGVEAAAAVPSVIRAYLAALSAPAPAPGAEAVEIGDGEWQELVEKNDRTSPAEYPDMALITRDELNGFIATALTALSAKLAEVEREHAASRQNFHTMQHAADALRKRAEAAEASAADLRSIISECAKALGNGAYIAPSCTIEFMGYLPGEIRLVVADLRRKLEEARKALEARRSSFPILGSGGQKIDFALVADHGEQAKRNHYQTVTRLAERGGLSWTELYAVLHNKPWAKMDENEAVIACRALEARYLDAIDRARTLTSGADHG